MISKSSSVLIVENFENFTRTCRDISFFHSWKYKGKSNFETEIFENTTSRMEIDTNRADRVNRITTKSQFILSIFVALFAI